MKKIMIWAVLLCLLLSACAQQNETQPTSNKVTTLPSDLWISDFDTIIFNNIDSYNQFVQVADLPDNFVYYESLMVFGEFESMEILSSTIYDYLEADYSECFYTFCDEKGNKLQLWVGVERTKVTTIDSEHMGDMRVIDPLGDVKTGSVFRNDVEYKYNGGKLRCISWESNGIPFTLGTEVEGDIFYPEDGPLTIVHELLHTDTNKAAMEKINTALENPAVK